MSGLRGGTGGSALGSSPGGCCPRPRGRDGLHCTEDGADEVWRELLGPAVVATFDGR